MSQESIEDEKLDTTNADEVVKRFHKENRVKVIGSINKWKRKPIGSIEFHLVSDDGGEGFFENLETKLKGQGFIASVNTHHKMFYLDLPSRTYKNVEKKIR